MMKYKNYKKYKEYEDDYELYGYESNENNQSYNLDMTQNSCVCKKCESLVIYKPDDIWWDENGYGYSTALVRCNHCNCINVVKYIDDTGIN